MKKIAVSLLVAGLLLAGCGSSSKSASNAAATSSACPHNPIRFAVEPYDTGPALEAAYKSLASDLQAKLGCPVSLIISNTYVAEIDAMRAGQIEIGEFGPLGYVLAHKLANAQPVAAFGDTNGKPDTYTAGIWVPKNSSITSLQQLKGKTVGDAGISYQHSYLQTILSHAHVPAGSVKEVNVGANLVPSLVSGRVNAILGGYWNYEAIQLAQLHQHPSVLHMNEVGVPTYDELVLVVRRSTLASQPGLIRRLVQAMARGYESARTNPTAAVANLVKANPSLDSRFQAAAVRATLPVFFPSNSSQPWGYQDQVQWNSYGQWMLSNHLISNPSAVADASTNEELAGQGL